MNLTRLLAKLNPIRSCRTCMRIDRMYIDDEERQTENKRRMKIYCIPCKFNQGKWNGEYDNWI